MVVARDAGGANTGWNNSLMAESEVLVRLGFSRALSLQGFVEMGGLRLDRHHRLKATNFFARINCGSENHSTELTLSQLANLLRENLWQAVLCSP